MPRSHRDALDPDLRRTAWRIGVQTAVLLLGCLVVVGAVVLLSVIQSQEEQLRQSLSAAAVAAAGPHGGDADRDRDRDLSQPRGGIQTAVLHAGQVHTSGQIPTGLPDLSVMQHVADSGVADERTVELPTGSYAVLTVKRGDDIVQAIASRYEQHQERERILGALAVAGGAGLVLATLAAGLLARRAVRPMASALELQRRFVADAGHELRTPLTLLSTRAQLLARRVRSVDGAPTQEAAQLIGRDAEGIVTDTSSLTAVLEELLMAADVRTPVPQELVDVSALATAAVAAALATAEGADLTLGLENGEGSMMTIGAPTALSRSVTALIDNALGHARTHVTVTVIRERRHVVVTVIDDGPGIATDLLPRVFERFRGERAVGPDDGAARHFGLGLSLVSEIARRHGGTVTATNRTSPDTGAVLSLAVPAA